MPRAISLKPPAAMIERQAAKQLADWRLEARGRRQFISKVNFISLLYLRLDFSKKLLHSNPKYFSLQPFHHD